MVLGIVSHPVDNPLPTNTDEFNDHSSQPLFKKNYFTFTRMGPMFGIYTKENQTTRQFNIIWTCKKVIFSVPVQSSFSAPQNMAGILENHDWKL